MKSRRPIVLLTTLAVLVGMLSACGSPGAEPVTGVPEEDKYGGTFVWPQTGNPNTLLYAWIQSGWTNRMSSLLNDKLFVFDKDGDIVYRVCDSHTVSDDGTLYTLHVRDGVLWHDGTPVTAKDIVWTHDIQFSPDWFMALQYYVPGEWTAVDDHTFTIKLDEPDPAFMYSLSDMMFPQPEHYWADVTPANFFSCEKATKPIGCGPFKFVEYKVGDYLKLEAFEDFWNGRPYLDNAFIKITGSAQNTEIAFEAGEVSAYTTTEDYYEEIKDDERFQFLIGPSSMVAQVNMSTNYYKEKDVNKEALIYTGDRAIREAMAYLVPYEDVITKVLRGAAERSYSFVPTDAQWYTDEGIVKYTYDVEKAKKILDDAGYVDTDGDGVRNYSDGSNITMKVSYYDQGGLNERLCILYAEQLNKAGIAAALSTSEMTSWVETLLKENPEFNPDEIDTELSVYYYGGGDPIPFLNENRKATWGGQSSYINWESGKVLDDETLKRMYAPEVLEAQKRVDDLFIKMRSTKNEAEAKEAFAEIQRIFANEIIDTINIATMQRRMAFQANIRGIEDAIWHTNNNYLGFAMEKIWIEK